MTPDQIRDILNNFNNLKWDNENYNNFVAHVKALDLNTVDEDLKGKVTSFLATANEPKDFGNSEKIAQVEATQPVAETIVPTEPIVENNLQPASMDVVDGLNPELINLDSTPQNTPTPVDQPVAPVVSNEQMFSDNLMETPITQGDSIIEEAKPTEKKPKKKSNIILIIVTLIILLGGVGYYLVYSGIIDLSSLTAMFNKEKENDNTTPVTETTSLTCHNSTYEEETNITQDAIFTMDFEDDKPLKYTLTTSYKYENKELYDSMVNAFKENEEESESEVTDAINKLTNDSKVTYDEENLTIIVSFTIVIADLQNSSQDENATFNPENLLSYQKSKDYLVGLGYNCDGEATSNDNDNIVDNNPNQASNMYAITEKIAASNNLFSYKELNFEISNNNLMGRTSETKNISGSGQLLNIKIKLYDADKNEIGEYQLQSETEIKEDSIFYIAPDVSKPMNFVIDASKLTSKTISDVKYFTVENL